MASNRSSIAMSDFSGDTAVDDESELDRLADENELDGLADEVISTISSIIHLELKSRWLTHQLTSIDKGTPFSPGQLTYVPFPLGAIPPDETMTRQRALLSETLATIRSEVLESNQFTVEVPSAWTQIARVDEIEPLLRNNLFWSIVRSRLTGRRVEPVTNLVEEVQSLVKASILFPEMMGGLGVLSRYPVDQTAPACRILPSVSQSEDEGRPPSIELDVTPVAGLGELRMIHTMFFHNVEAKLNEWPHLRERINDEVPHPVTFDDAAKASLKEAIKETFTSRAESLPSLARGTDLMSTFCGTDEGTKFKIRWV